MAKTISMQNPTTGINKTGFYGFSWTTLLFGGFPALFRGDFVLGLVFIVLQLLTWGISGLILAFFYNKHFTLRLIEKGYRLNGSARENAKARAELGISDIRSSQRLLEEED